MPSLTRIAHKNVLIPETPLAAWVPLSTNPGSATDVEYQHLWNQLLKYDAQISNVILRQPSSLNNLSHIKQK